MMQTQLTLSYQYERTRVDQVELGPVSATPHPLLRRELENPLCAHIFSRRFRIGEQAWDRVRQSNARVRHESERNLSRTTGGIVQKSGTAIIVEGCGKPLDRSVHVTVQYGD